MGRVAVKEVDRIIVKGIIRGVLLGIIVAIILLLSFWYLRINY